MTFTKAERTVLANMPELIFETPKNPSSRITDMAYHEESQTAVARFPDTVQYHYGPMSRAEYEAWRDADSPGSYLHKVISKTFGFHKADADHPAECSICDWEDDDPRDLDIVAEDEFTT